MNKKEQADCLIDLHREQLSKFKQTRNIEFKVNISLWTIIIISGYYLKDIKLSSCYHRLIFLILFLILTLLIAFVHYKCWMFPVQRSEDIDDFYVRKYRFNIEQLTNSKISIDPGDKKEIKSFSDFSPSSKNWIRFEVGITLFLMLINGIYIYLTNL